MDGVPHHLLGTYEVSSKVNVKVFQDDAVEVIRDIHSRGHVAVIVGGTNFYVESLLFDNALPSESAHSGNSNLKANIPTITCSLCFYHLILPIDVKQETYPGELHTLLSRVCAEAAAAIHPKDIRRLRRALICHQQWHDGDRGDGMDGGRARYPGSVVVVVQCEATVLQQRLRDRYVTVCCQLICMSVCIYVCV